MSNFGIRHLTTVAAVAASAVALTAEGIGRTSAPAGRPDVYVISVDTLRSDHLPVYGYKGVRTPNIDALRRDSVLFLNAFTVTPLTLPAHATILTGVLPREHGLRDNGAGVMRPLPTLAGRLKARGYATGAAVSAWVLRRQTGIASGFDFYDDGVPLDGRADVVQRPGPEALRAAKQWIARSDRPRFFFLHFYEPHAPYDAPSRYRQGSATAYDAEIAYADELVGDFLSFLRSRGNYDESIVVFLSDHGEGLGDHGEADHGIFVYRETLQVPLMIKLPHGMRAGQTSTPPVSLVDLAPTLLEAADGRLASGTAGSLLGRTPPRRAIYSESYYPRLRLGWSALQSLIVGSEHFINAPSAELYDLASDPAERKNLAAKKRRDIARMRETLAQFAGKSPNLVDGDEESRRRLEALGYLGRGADGAAGPLPDPKTRIGILIPYEQALAAMDQRRFKEAVRLFDAILAEHPRYTEIASLRAKAAQAVTSH